MLCVRHMMRMRIPSIILYYAGPLSCILGCNVQLPPDLFQLQDHVVWSVHTPDAVILSIQWRQHYHHTQAYHFAACMGNNIISVWLQSAVGGPELLQMASLTHMKTQQRELRYFSGVNQSLCQLGEWWQHVQQMEGGILTQLVLNAMVRWFSVACKNTGMLTDPVMVAGGVVVMKHWTVNWMGFSPTCKDLLACRMHSAYPKYWGFF